MYIRTWTIQKIDSIAVPEALKIKNSQIFVEKWKIWKPS